MRGICQTLSTHGEEEKVLKDLVENRKKWDYLKTYTQMGKYYKNKMKRMGL
jgi:hypothetical protein